MSAKKIQRVSLIFRILFQVAFVLMILAPFIYWFLLPLMAYFHLPLPKSQPMMTTLTLSNWFIGFFVSWIPTAIKLVITYQLIKLFRLYEKQQILTIANAKRIKKIGYFVLIGQIVEPFWQGFKLLLITWNDPTGLRLFAMHLTPFNFGMILLSLIIIVVSWVMEEGARAYEENQQFI